MAIKELTVEEKAQRYDAAIEVINKCETDKYGCIIGVKPTDIFPELKESEDEKMLNKLILFFNWTGNYRFDKSDCDAARDWLKLLKERVQSKQYWSDEDYNEIETIACHLDNTDNEGMADVLRNIRDKYYHIIPQNTWKPSDEQLEAIKCAAIDVKTYSSRSEQLMLENEPYYKAFVSLYNDLKKLRDE